MHPLLAGLDPAQPGFARRMRGLLSGCLLLLVAATLLAAIVLPRRLPRLGFWTGVVQLELGMHRSAERGARRLIQAAPEASFDPYRLLAASLRRQGRDDEQLAVLDEAALRLPESWRAQGNRCWYHSLFGDPSAAMDACDRAVALAPDDDSAALTWRGVARALGGDDPGALDDLRAAVARGEAAGRRDAAHLRVRAWLAALEAGQDPFDAATLTRERERF